MTTIYAASPYDVEEEVLCETASLDERTAERELTRFVDRENEDITWDEERDGYIDGDGDEAYFTDEDNFCIIEYALERVP